MKTSGKKALKTLLIVSIMVLAVLVTGCGADESDTESKSSDAAEKGKIEVIGEYTEGIAKARKDGKYGFVNEEEKEVIPFDYDAISDFEEDGLAKAEKDGKFGYIDREGNDVVAFEYDNIGSYHGDFAIIEKDGKFGFIGRDKKELTPCEFDHVNDFVGDRASVTKGDESWYIDRYGNKIN